ncbi:hypothetical protein ACIDC4_12375 [Flavobacterium sp. C3NV]
MKKLTAKGAKIYAKFAKFFLKLMSNNLAKARSSKVFIFFVTLPLYEIKKIKLCELCIIIKSYIKNLSALCGKNSPFLNSR